MEDVLQVTYLGHACLKIRLGDYVVVVDPYKDDTVPGLRNLSLEADQLLVSHEHGDHNHREAVSLSKREAPCPFVIETFEAAHDEVGGKKRGMTKMFSLVSKDYKIVFLGDLGEDLPEDLIEAFREADLLFIPVGGYYTIDPVQAKEVAKKLRPQVIIPIHYVTEASGYQVLAPVEDFTSLFDHVSFHLEETFTYEKGVDQGVVVLHQVMQQPKIH